MTKADFMFLMILICLVSQPVQRDDFIPSLPLPHSEARIQPVTHIVIHHFTLSVAEMLRTLDRSRISVHYIIDTAGHIIPVVPEDKVAWHAGISYWHGLNGLNKASVGIELQHPDFGQTPFSEEQIAALIPLVQDIMARYHIPPENIVGHSDIVPDAKADPGKAFPWQRLVEAGIGLWYRLNDTDKMAGYTVKELLDIIGYPTEGRDLESSAYAFRRRWLPEQVAYDDDVVGHGQAIFEARTQATSLPPEERAAFLAKAPRIHPPDDGTFLTDPDFIRVLRAVAYRYQTERAKNRINMGENE